ncbi:SMP-30/gluconolactonase/LRE family protein [Kordiimonas aquimaris]|uniref:SMP-30/gluconolactonase/LRE family protein n=1 Tax=Kordiimonas aquimaris TaxID=707591 RepID=UPI0021CE949D|nr:SMP-30/gluconolactonase/LRE family protein [Kordiimonas aquimaris]
MKKLLIGGGITAVLFGGLLLETMHSAGVFRTIEPHFSGMCTRVEGVIGAEDITIDHATGIAYISAMDRRSLGATGKYDGGIYRYMPGSFKRPIKLEADTNDTFHPHGISLWKNQSDNDRLFVVSHPPSEIDPKVATSQVDVFEIDGDHLRHIQTVEPDEPISLNDVTAAGPDSFYASIDQGSVTPLGRTLETYGRLARAGIMRGENGKMRRVLSDLIYANGIQISVDKHTLYVAETTGKRLSAYSIEPQNGALDLQVDQQINSGLDNIEIDSDGNLWVVGHPKTFDFLGHAADATKRSPSQVFMVNISNNEIETKEIYLNDGNPISGASVAAPAGDRFLIGSVFEPFILDCSL